MTFLFWLKFTGRLIKHVGLLLGVLLPLEIIGWVILLPILLVVKDNLRLPVIFKWFDNADLWVGRNTETYEGIVKQGTWARYVWLAWRNPINYFGYAVMGYTVPAEGMPPVSEQIGVPGIGDHSKPGFYYIELTWIEKHLIFNPLSVLNTNSLTEVEVAKRIYEYYYVHQWSADRCLRFRMGHKIGAIERNKPGSTMQYVSVIQPYKDFHVS